MPLDATPGSASANSYATVAEGDSYHEAHLYATSWTSATSPNKEAALRMATRIIDAQFIWNGAAASEAQALSWPRYGLTNRNGFAIPSTVIPTELKQATCELARLLLTSDVTAAKSQDIEGLKELKAGPVEFVFKDEIPTQPIPNSALYYIPKHWYLELRSTDDDKEYAEIDIL